MSTQVYARKIGGRIRYFRLNADDAKRLGADPVKPKAAPKAAK